MRFDTSQTGLQQSFMNERRKMRATKLTYLLIFTLALAFAGTGCRKKPVDVTNLPGRPKPYIGGEKPSGFQGEKTPASEDVKPGGGQTSETWSPDDPNLVADRATLSAHTVHFDYDSSAIKASEKAHVEAVASALRSDAPVKLLIEGHCDERGTEEYNRSLGERRALALREELAKMGIDPNRIRTVSFGEDKPSAQGHDESAWSQNRRGEFVLYHPK